MKVTGKQPPNISELSTGKAKGKDGNAAPTRSGQPRDVENEANRISLNTMNKIRETIGAEPDVRAERVAEVKAKLKRGELKVDPDKLAGKMLTASLKEDLERP